MPRASYGGIQSVLLDSGFRRNDDKSGKPLGINPDGFNPGAIRFTFQRVPWTGSPLCFDR